MKPLSIVKRGDIYYADLSPVVGSEQGGMRPVLIVQNDTGNKHSPTVIAAAITSQTGKAKLPTHIELSGQSVGLTRDSVILLEDVSNLVANRIFGHHPGTFRPVLEDILTLAGRCKTLIAVSISGMNAEEYDGETADYIRALNELNEQLISHASMAVEMKNRTPVNVK